MAIKSHHPIRFASDSKQNTAFSKINQQLAATLSQQGWQIADDPSQNDIVIHHNFYEDFSEVTRPACKKFVAYRTWDFGVYPKKWVDIINNQFDQLWVYSEWNKQNALNSGIQANKVVVVPLGVDTAIYRPDGHVAEIPTQKKFAFIFVGGTVYRKGFDILLSAYTQAFDASDDVVLVIKDSPADDFYQDISYRNEIKEAIAKPNGPEIVYFDQYLSEQELAELFRAANVGVFPYRSEGFAMPILELMACGVPSIVPKFGPSLDYCKPDRAFLIDAKRFNLPVRKEMVYNNLGYKALVDEVDFCEVPIDRLADMLHTVYHSHLEKIVQKGIEGSRFAHAKYSWEDTVGRIETAIYSMFNSHEN